MAESLWNTFGDNNDLTGVHLFATWGLWSCCFLWACVRWASHLPWKSALLMFKALENQRQTTGGLWRFYWRYSTEGLLQIQQKQADKTMQLVDLFLLFFSSKILSRCDVSLIQEVRDSKGEIIPALVKQLNRYKLWELQDVWRIWWVKCYY